MARNCWRKDRLRKRSRHFGTPWRTPRRMSSRGPRWASLSSSRVTLTRLHPIYPAWLSSILRTALVWMGLAEISLAGGDKKRALQLFRQALSKEWPAQEESRRRSAQLKYAALLTDAGRQGEAISLLLSMIEQHGDDPAVGKNAADTVKAIGSPEQVEASLRGAGQPLPRGRQCLVEAW